METASPPLKVSRKAISAAKAAEKAAIASMMDRLRQFITSGRVPPRVVNGAFQSVEEWKAAVEVAHKKTRFAYQRGTLDQLKAKHAELHALMQSII